VGIADRIVDLDPNNAVVHYTRALVMQEIGRSQDAAQAIEAGARIRPRPPEAYVYQVAALAYLDLKRPQDAARWARSGIEANVSPEATTLHVLLAAALADSGDKEGAIGELDGVLVADPSERRARELLARVTKVDASRLLLTETFSALPKWVADGGADVGSVRNGILRAGSAGPNVWRVTVDGQDLPEVRVEWKVDDELALAAAIRELPDEQRQVIELKFLMGATNAQVAAALGKSEGAVNAKQWRALGALRKMLEET